MVVEGGSEILVCEAHGDSDEEVFGFLVGEDNQRKGAGGGAGSVAIEMNSTPAPGVRDEYDTK